MNDQPTGPAGPDVVRRAVRDGAWNAAALAIPGIASIVIVAYLFRSVGPAGFAPWAMAGAMLGFLTILDSGLSATTARHAARALAGDTGAMRVVRTAYAAYAVLGLLVFAVGSLASPLIPAILGLEGDAARTSIVICVVLSIDLAVVTATGGWVGTLRGGRRFDLICAASVVHVAVSVPATILLVPPLGLPGAALAQLGGRLAGRLVAGIALVRTFPTITPRPGRVTRSDARILGLFALPVLAAGISTQLGIGADPIIVGLAAGPAAVGLYAAGSSIVRYAAFLLLPVVAVLLPSFAELGYTRPAEIAPTVLRCTRIAAAIGVIAFGSMAVSATPLLLAWIGEADNLSVNVLVLYALAHVAWVPSQVLVMALVAAGRHGPVGAALLIDAIINVVVSIALVVLIGPIGAAISSFVMLTAVHGVVIPLIASRRLPMPKPALALSLGKGGLSGLLVVMLVATVPAEGLAGLILRGAIAFGAIVAVVAFDQRTSGRRPVAAPAP